MTLGNKIQEIRVARGMSQEQFGEMLNTTRQTVSKWELDQVVPDIRKIVAISKLFCISTDELLIQVTTFENEGVRFACGVYRDKTSEIIETEKIAIRYYFRDNAVLGARFYEGNGDMKLLTSICEKNYYDNSICYVYSFINEKGERETAGNCEEYKRYIGEKFDRQQLGRMKCTESFQVNHGEFRLHTVREAGIRRCLEEWRKGVRMEVSMDEFFVNICTGRIEYVYSIKQRDDDVYCGCSYNIPFEIGVRSYGQFFRLRNYQDNSQGFCACCADFAREMPQEIYSMEEADAGCSLSDLGCWFVKRYQDDEIVLHGCSEEEYVYRMEDSKYERFI